MPKALSGIEEPAGRAGKRPGPAAVIRHPRPTAVVVADRFDTMTWREIYDEVTGLRDLAHRLNARYDHTEDLLTDVFLAACKVSPQLREQAAMDPSRLVNHLVVTALTDSPEFAGLRREIASDPYAAAMAVLALSDALRGMLERAKEAAARAGRA
ncbi:MAG TPA: hypothetical protein VIS09_26180, partial [Streptomyces sp.]